MEEQNDIEMSELIAFTGGRVQIPTSELKTRVSVYGICFDGNEVLLLPNKLSEVLSLGVPGGEIEEGENHEQALRRELKQEIGTDKVQILKYVDKAKNLFYYNPPGEEPEAFDAVMHFYLCRVDRGDVRDGGDSHEGPPGWYNLDLLKERDFPALLNGSILQIIKEAQDP